MPRPSSPCACHTFITEATFGLPIYTWDPPGHIVADIMEWWKGNRDQGRSSVLFCYALGKAQRILAELCDLAPAAVHLHGAMLAFTEMYRGLGVRLAATERVAEGARGRALAGSLVLAPLSARGTPWMRRFANPSTAFASGLMRIRGVRRQRGFDRGFVLSDHADWRALLDTIARDRRQPRARDAWLVRRVGAVPRRTRTGDRHDRDQVRGRTGGARVGTGGASVKRFAALYDAIDRTTSTNAKIAALAAYFRDAPPADAAWAVFFLTGRRLKRLIPWPLLRQWSRELTGVPEWLMESATRRSATWAS